MTVANGREFLAIPGPTNIPDAVLAAMHRPAIDIYSGDMVERDPTLPRGSAEDLPHGRPDVHLRGQRPRRLGGGGQQRPVARRDGAGAGVRPVRRRLGRDGADDGRQGRGAEGRLAARGGSRRGRPSACAPTPGTRSRPSWSCRSTPPPASSTTSPRSAGRSTAAGHPALLMVDCVASLGCMPFEMDGWGVDVAMAGSQKGLMTPPGLAFVAANERARRPPTRRPICARATGTGRSARARCTTRSTAARRRSTCSSRLRKALDLLFAEGLEHAARRHALLAEATRQAVARWAEGRVLAFNVRHAAERANSVTTILMPGRDPRALLDYCRDKCGVVLGVGIGDLSGKAFRIAHMGHVNAPMVFGVLGAVEMGAGRARHSPRRGRRAGRGRVSGARGEGLARSEPLAPGAASRQRSVSRRRSSTRSASNASMRQAFSWSRVASASSVYVSSST